MKYVDKLRQDHHDWDEFTIGYKVGECCPGEFGYPEDCDSDCENCWQKEFPTSMKEEPKKTLEEVLNNSPNVRILDSGDRTQFESGAVRDMREGKGRCDLMPLEVISSLMRDPMINLLNLFQETGDTCHLYECLNTFSIKWDDGKTKHSMRDIVTQRHASMFLEVAKHFEEGAKKYGENNWQQGLPVNCYLDSAIRHYLKYRRGDKDEPHDRAFVWNIMCCIWEVDYHNDQD